MSEIPAPPLPKCINPLIRRVGSFLFIFLFITYGYFYQSGEHNENARFDQMKAIIKLGQLSINPYLDNTADVITIGDLAYPNKAPGMLIPTLPVFFITDQILSFLKVQEPWHGHLLCYLSGWLSVGFGSALLGTFLFFAVTFISRSPWRGLFITLAYSLGTIAFPFSTLFFSHQLSATLVWFSFFILFALHQWNRSPSEAAGYLPRFTSSSWYLLAGILLSLAAISEYPCAIAGLAIGLYALCTTRSWKRLILFIVGGVLPAIPLGIYNYAIQGSIFWVTYSAKSQFSAHNLGFAGVRIPDLQTLYEITFKPQRGIFYINPWLIIGAFGILIAPFRRFLRGEYLVASFIVLGFFAFNAGFGDSIIYWGGAGSTGPRHIIPALPFLALLAVRPFAWLPTRIVATPLVLFSIGVMLMATAVEPRVPYDYSNPLTGFFWPHFFTGRFSLLDVGTFSHALMTKDSVAFNWGELLTLPGYLQLAPLLLLWVVGFFIALRLVREADSSSSSSTLVTAIRVVIPIIIVVVLVLPMVGEYQRLRPPPGNHGLTGTYIRRIWWEGGAERYLKTPVKKDKIDLVRHDTTIDFDWMYNGLPIRGEMSIEWRGTLRVPLDGLYTFAIHSDDAGILLLDQDVVVDNWGDHGPQERTATVRLAAGMHPIIVRYYNRLFGGLIQLKWKLPGHDQLVIIPSEMFTIDTPPL